MIYGLDLLGLAQFGPVGVKNFPQGWALGVFADTFGDPIKHVRKIVASGKCPHVRVQLLWSDTHTFVEADVARAIRLAKPYDKIALNNPKVRIEISLFCEHNITDGAQLDAWLARLQKACPNCVVVNCPYRGALSRKFKNEVHGDHAAPKGKYNYSYDGTSSVDANVTKDKSTHKRSEVFFFWIPQFNGKLNASDPTPRPLRKAWPTKEQIESVVYLATDKGKTRLMNNQIWKSHADQHEVPPEPRASKPVFITPTKADRIDLYIGKQKVGVMPYYGPFDGGGHRYYLNQFGYKVEKIVELRANGDVLGKVNPAFRDGSYR